jgi:N-acetylmuramoyl-L-alanine amidase
VIAALALLFQAAAPPIVVRSATGRVDTLHVVATQEGEDAVSADALARALGGTATIVRGGRTRITVQGTTVEVAEGLPYLVAGDSILPLTAAPVVEQGRTLVPVQLVTDVLPRVVTGLLFDGAARELRAFPTTVARRTPRDSAPAPVIRKEAPTVTAEPAPGAAPVTPPAAGGTRRRTVVVDAGHGGPDGGMQGTLPSGRPVEEKTITLGVARELQTALRDRGIGVVMTRTRDTLIALSDRGRIANQRKADLFISIHVNAANPAWRDAAGARGFETYFLAEAKTEDARRVAEMENESVRFESGGEAQKGDPLSFIMADMAQNEHLRESSELADRIQRRLARAHPGPSRGVKQAGFRVLVTAFMPAVLVEIGYGTNRAEAAYIASPEGQRQLARAIAEAAMEYLADYERRVAPAGGGTR